MARGRFVSESIAKDARLNSLSIEAELIYLKTIPHLDRDGLIEGDPDVLWGTVCPKRRRLIDRMASFVQEWAKAGLVLCYDTNEGVVLWFTGFTKNQIGLRYDREAPSRFPPPPGFYRGKDGIVVEPPPPPETPLPPELPTDSGDGQIPSDELPDENLSSADSIPQEAGVTPAELRQNSGDSVAQLEVKDQVQVKGQDQAQAQPAAPPPKPACDVLGPKALIEDLRGRRFVYLDSNANLLAAALLDDFGWDRIMAAADIAEKRHKDKAVSGKRGITAPLAYIRSILEGTLGGDHGTSKASGATGSEQPDEPVQLDPAIQQRLDEHRAKRKAEGSLYYGSH